MLAPHPQGVDQEATPQSQNESFRDIVATVPDLLFLYDVPRRGCVYMNRQYAECLGVSPEQVEEMGTNLFERLLHPEDAPLFSQWIDHTATLQDGEAQEVDYRLRHADGEWRWFQCRKAVFSWQPQGTPRQILCVARDITEHRRNEDCRRDKDVAVAIERLASHVAHEVNTPLANVKNSLFLLRNTLQPDHPGVKYIQWSEEEVDRIARTVRQLSSFIQLEP